MKRETEDQREDDNSRENKRSKIAIESSSTSSSSYSWPPQPLDLNNLGAGYNSDDIRVIKALEIYENKLLPFIKDNESVFKSSNFLNIKGYGTDISIN